MEPFRGNVQRWTFATGTLAGSVLDAAFSEDGSLVWRIVAGPRQGESGRERRLAIQHVRTGLHLATFSLARYATLAVAIDFPDGRISGYVIDGGVTGPVAGTFEIL
jgi:hypothetical protein